LDSGRGTAAASEVQPPVRATAAASKAGEERAANTGHRLQWIAVATLVTLALATAAFFLGQHTAKAIMPVYHLLTYRRGTIRMARLAPDGQTVIYSAAWEGAPVEVFSTRPESPESRSLGLSGAEILAVSSAGEMAVLLNSRQMKSMTHTGTLARVPLVGGAPREVLENVQWADWSPDGAALAVVHEIGEQATSDGRRGPRRRRWYRLADGDPRMQSSRLWLGVRSVANDYDEHSGTEQSGNADDVTAEPDMEGFAFEARVVDCHVAGIAGLLAGQHGCCAVPLVHKGREQTATTTVLRGLGLTGLYLLDTIPAAFRQSTVILFLRTHPLAQGTAHPRDAFPAPSTQPQFASPRSPREQRSK